MDIYEYIKLNFFVEVVDYNFERDYILNPLKKIRTKNNNLVLEYPCKKDFEYIVNGLCLPINFIYKLLGCGHRSYYKWCKEFNVYKTKESKLKATRRTSNIVYGVDYPIKSKKVLKTRDENNLRKYGYVSYTQTNEYKEKTKATNLKKYNTVWYFQSNDYKNKMNEYLNDLGVTNVFQCEEYKEKSKQTKLHKYGDENYNNRIKAKQTCNEHFGVDYPQQCRDVYDKGVNTKLKNGTFNTSHNEKKIYDMLVTKYKDVKTQYKSDKYPFWCDFYIPKLDLYIEYQEYPGHGKEPYIGSIEQKNIVRKWERKSLTNGPMYKNFIHVWTKSDPLKRKTAKDNNLNWIEFFNICEFETWFKSTVDI